MPWRKRMHDFPKKYDVSVDRASRSTARQRVIHAVRRVVADGDEKAGVANDAGSELDLAKLNQTADSPRSSVRMRTTSSSGRTKTFPSPIFPVLPALTIVSTALPAASSATATSSFTLGRKSTVYSLPR